MLPYFFLDEKVCNPDSYRDKAASLFAKIQGPPSLAILIASREAKIACHTCPPPLASREFFDAKRDEADRTIKYSES